MEPTDEEGQMPCFSSTGWESIEMENCPARLVSSETKIRHKEKEHL
jgi:hypothetical protein